MSSLDAAYHYIPFMQSSLSPESKHAWYYVICHLRLLAGDHSFLHKVLHFAKLKRIYTCIIPNIGLIAFSAEVSNIFLKLYFLITYKLTMFVREAPIL